MIPYSIVTHVAYTKYRRSKMMYAPNIVSRIYRVFWCFRGVGENFGEGQPWRGHVICITAMLQSANIKNRNYLN